PAPAPRPASPRRPPASIAAARAGFPRPIPAAASTPAFRKLRRSIVIRSLLVPLEVGRAENQPGCAAHGILRDHSVHVADDRRSRVVRKRRREEGVREEVNSL